MKIVLGVVALLVAVAVAGLVAKAQLTSASRAHAAPAQGGPSDLAPAAPLMQQPAQIKQQVEGLMQQARPMPEDTK